MSLSVSLEKARDCGYAGPTLPSEITPSYATMALAVLLNVLLDENVSEPDPK